MSQEKDDLYFKFNHSAIFFGAILGIVIPLLFWGLPKLFASSGDAILLNHPGQVYWSLGIMLSLFVVVLAVEYQKSNNASEFFQFFLFPCSVLVLYLNLGGIIIQSIFGLVLAVLFVDKVLSSL
jgi:hypothetical protein